MDNLIADLRFLQQLQPDMIGIGPYVPHADTPFAGQPTGDLALTLRLVSLLRLLFPYALIPATTALGTIHPQGRERGLQAGANVVMPCPPSACASCTRCMTTKFAPARRPRSAAAVWSAGCWRQGIALLPLSEM